MLIKHWNVAILILTLSDVLCAQNCTSSNVCFIKPGTKPFSEQVIEAGRMHSNASFTILVYAGNYNSTNGSTMNFINFRNVTIKKHPNNAMPVNVMCPGITTDHYDGVGFENSVDIEIVGMNFMGCGIVTSGLYFESTSNITVRDSTFHHNTDNGIQIIFGNNIYIINCTFYSNIGLQPDQFSDLIINNDFVDRTRGVGLGLFFENQNYINVTIIGCNFTNNIAYKPSNYNSSRETRPYGFIPFGSGGGIYLKFNRVNSSYTNIISSNFYNNTAINQGGAIVVIPLNSADNVLNISDCKFVGNKVLGFLLSSFNVTVSDTIKLSQHAIDDFINLINEIFSVTNLNLENLQKLNFSTLISTGGSGGAISVNLFSSVEHNVLHVSNSQFIGNAAFAAGAIDFIVRDLLSEVENGVDSNQAFVDKYVIIVYAYLQLYYGSY